MIKRIRKTFIILKNLHHNIKTLQSMLIRIGDIKGISYSKTAIMLIGIGTLSNIKLNDARMDAIMDILRTGDVSKERMASNSMIESMARKIIERYKEG